MEFNFSKVADQQPKTLVAKQQISSQLFKVFNRKGETTICSEGKEKVEMMLSDQ